MTNLTFTSLTPKARRQAKKNAGLVNQSQVRGKNRLAELREKAATSPEPEKVHKVCQCVWRQTELGPRFATQPDCVKHKQFGENPSFSQHPERAATHTRRRKATGDGNGG